MSVDVAVTAFSGGAAIAMGSDDEVHVLISSDNGATWTALEVFNTANTPSNTGDLKVYDLAAYTSATTKFAFCQRFLETSDSLCGSCNGACKR